MKTEKKIKQWICTHAMPKNDTYLIKGYLSFFNIDIKKDVFVLGDNGECFDDFVEWFNKSNAKSKYKKGDYVRINDNLLGVICFCDNKNYFIRTLDRARLHCFHERELELAMPKDGEFWFYPKETIASNVISDGNYAYNLEFDYKWKITNHRNLSEVHEGNPRPATEKESELFIKAIEEEYNVIWNGKKWIDILKVGDLVIGWDTNDVYNAMIGRLTDITDNKECKYCISYTYFENAIKCDSIEQYKEFISKNS